jgi:hypothetical protein
MHYYISIFAPVIGAENPRGAKQAEAVEQCVQGSIDRAGYVTIIAISKSTIELKTCRQRKMLLVV